MKNNFRIIDTGKVVILISVFFVFAVAVIVLSRTLLPSILSSGWLKIIPVIFIIALRFGIPILCKKKITIQIEGDDYRIDNIHFKIRDISNFQLDERGLTTVLTFYFKEMKKIRLVVMEKNEEREKFQNFIDRFLDDIRAHNSMNIAEKIREGSNTKPTYPFLVVAALLVIMVDLFLILFSKAQLIAKIFILIVFNTFLIRYIFRTFKKKS